MKLHPIVRGTLCFLLAAALCGCAAQASAPEDEGESAAAHRPPKAAVPVRPEKTIPPTTLPPDPLAEMVRYMTLREKVGQLFIVFPEALEMSQEREYLTEMTDSMAEAMTKYPVGGIIMFAGNITSPQQIMAFNQALQSAGSIPMFLCVDEEGGLVARLANSSAFALPKYRSAAAVGSGADPEDALDMGRTIGSYLKYYGFNTNFAPVADVNTNPNNPVIGSRAFSSDPVIAAQMASAFAQGLREQGIIATFKHFPGHGDTAQDSHYGIAVSYKTESELQDCEWLPFLQATGSDFIMVGHIALPGITGDLTPATMSREIVTGILKEELGFEGLVITDSLSMGAITDSYDSGEAAVLALQAGCDLLLMPSDLSEAFEAVVAAVGEGTLSQEWLDETVLRILEFKMAHGMLN